MISARRAIVFLCAVILGLGVSALAEIERFEPESGGTTVYRLAGAFTDSKESYGLLDKVRADLEAGARRIVINLEKVPRITSGGIGILCACFTSLNNGEGSLALVGVDERNQALLNAVGLWDRLDHFATEAEAGLG